VSTKRVGTRSRAAVVPEETFAEVVRLIETARQRAFQAVNTELVGLYWQIGEYISGKLSAAEWGESVVDRLAEHLTRTVPGVRGFSAQNLWRMRQFFETYRSDPKLSPLVGVVVLFARIDTATSPVANEINHLREAARGTERRIVNACCSRLFALKRTALHDKYDYPCSSEPVRRNGATLSSL
jgi:hypothetical protein